MAKFVEVDSNGQDVAVLYKFRTKRLDNTRAPTWCVIARDPRSAAVSEHHDARGKRTPYGTGADERTHAQIHDEYVRMTQRAH